MRQLPEPARSAEEQTKEAMQRVRVLATCGGGGLAPRVGVWGVALPRIARDTDIASHVRKTCATTCTRWLNPTRFLSPIAHSSLFAQRLRRRSPVRRASAGRLRRYGCVSSR